MLDEHQALETVTAGYEAGKKFSETCLQVLINKNFFTPIEFLIDKVFNEKSGIDTVPALRKFISKIRDKQEYILDFANKNRHIITIGPAFQWAQDMDSVALLIKFAHRLDSPACIDLYDQNVTITDTNITITCMCRKHDEIVKFTMNHELYMKISGSYHEFQSGGRLYVNVTKAEGNQRWRRLLMSEEQPGNMRVWYDLMETIGDVGENTVFETDDAFEDLVHIEKPTRKRKKKNKRRKRNKAAAKMKEDL